MRKLRIFIVELILVGMLVAWFFEKFPEAVDGFIPWICLAILWHLSWEIVLENESVKRRLGNVLRLERRMTWIIAFIVGGCVSLSYLWVIDRELSSLAKSHTKNIATEPNPIVAQPAPSPTPSSPPPKTKPKPVLPKEKINPAILTTPSPIPSAKPDIRAEFVAAASPGIAVTNLSSDAVMHEPMVTVSAWNLDTRANLPVYAYTEKTIFVKKGTAVIIGSFDNPGMKPLIKTGDHVLGLVTVDCPDCSTARHYWVFFVYGGDSWYSPVPVGTTINIMDIARRINDTNWDVEEFMKQVPHEERLKPRQP